MRILRRINGVTLEERKRCDGLGRDIGVGNITLKVSQVRLRWINEGNKEKRTMTVEMKANTNI